MGLRQKLLSNKEAAEKISELLCRQSAELNASLADVERTCTVEEFTRYRDAIAKVMGAVFVEILEPLWDEFPDMSPAALKDQYEPEPPRE